MAQRQEQIRRGEELYQAAVENHRLAYEAAKLLPDAAARQEAFADADRVWNLQREYARKVRCGEEH